jgi:hypothetical protein
MEEAQQQLNAEETFQKYRADCDKNRGHLPSVPTPLIIVILPDSAAQIRKSVKHWSDTTTGIAT